MSLSRSFLALSRYHLTSGDREQASEIEIQASNTLSSLDEKFIPDDLKCLIYREKGSERILKEIFELGKELVKTRDYRDLVHKIISFGNRFTGAERGAIFMLEMDEEGESDCASSLLEISPPMK